MLPVVTNFEKFKGTSSATTGSSFNLTAGQDIEVGTSQFLQDYEDLVANDYDLLEFVFNSKLFILEPI